MACAALFEYKSRGGEDSQLQVEARLQSGEVDFEAVKKDFLVEATEQFEQIWRDADESEQQVLCQIAIGANITSQQRYLVRELRRKGHLTDDTPPAPFSQSFAEFLVEKHPDAAVENLTRQIPRQSPKETSFLSRVMGVFKRGNRK